jgi:hypothetical protein
MSALVDMGFLEVEVLGHQVSEFPEPFPGHNGLAVFEIDDLFQVAQSSAEVQVVIIISVVFFEGNVGYDELAAVQTEGFSGYLVMMFLMFGSLQILEGIGFLLGYHSKRILSTREEISYLNLEALAAVVLAIAGPVEV